MRGFAGVCHAGGKAAIAEIRKLAEPTASMTLYAKEP